MEEMEEQARFVIEYERDEETMAICVSREMNYVWLRQYQRIADG